MLRTGGLAALTAVGLMGSAFAQGAAVHSWSGFYLGASGGGGVGSARMQPTTSPVQQVTTTTTTAGPGGCQISSGVFPVLGSSFLSTGNFVQGPAGDIRFLPNPLLYTIPRSDAGLFNLIPRGPLVTRTESSPLLSTVVVDGRRIPSSTNPPADNNYVIQGLTASSGQLGALRLGQASSTSCGVVSSGVDLLVDSIWAGFAERGTIVAGSSQTTTTTTTALTGPLAAAQGVDAATMTALAGLAGRDLRPRISGAFGGAQIGYNFQTGRFVYGAEAEVSVAGLNGREQIGGFTAAADLNWFGLLRGRVGYAFDRVLVFAAGGLAVGETQLGYSFGGVGVSERKVSVGGAIGGGAQVALTRNVSVKAEYLYLNLGAATYLASYGYDARMRTEAHLARFGVNYQF